MIKVTFQDGKAFIETPYDKKFVGMMHDIGSAKWNGEAWVIPEQSIETARKCMMEVYGETDQVSSELITLKVTAKTEISTLRDSVRAFGKTLARASGRDSGARVGEDVELVSGKVTSGGSCKNWHSIVKEGSVLILRNVSKQLYDKRTEDEWSEEELAVELVPDEHGMQKKAELLAEKAKLELRLEQIKKELEAFAEAQADTTG